MRPSRPTAALALTLFLAALTGCADETPPRPPAPAGDRVERTEEEWRAMLDDETYRITRQKGTERAFTGKYWNSKADGIYACVGCDLPLYDSKSKFDSGTGWPSFTRPIVSIDVERERDSSWGMSRTEIHCRRCGSHLGHVFSDGPAPTGERHCVNSASLKLVERP